MLFRLLTLAALTLALGACSNKVLVKKDSCKEVYDGALLECEVAKK